jgi:hypothetical protein
LPSAPLAFIEKPALRDDGAHDVELATSPFAPRSRCGVRMQARDAAPRRRDRDDAVTCAAAAERRSQESSASFCAIAITGGRAVQTLAPKEHIGRRARF